ncbi:hypothetical protein G9A89_010046 [Geosiphon pyriformis]|nr:hypothetical protein G9A89_010046 [Geosiphon pyriformis]
MNNPAKQEDIICWHKDMNNLISIVTETKLKGKIHLWIATKFNGVRVFTSDQDSGNLGLGVTIVVNDSLARHVCKISEVPGRLLSIKMLFKNKLSVSILGLYAGASLATRFSQASKVNSLIAGAVNESSFVVLGGDFNEDGSRRCASFKKCLDLGLVNSLVGNSLAKCLTWKNSRGVVKTIDYVFVLSNLVNAIVNRDILDVSEYFDIDHQVVCMSVGLGGLLDVHLNSLCRQVNRNRWKFNIRGADESRWDNFRSATLANTAMFSDKFATAVRFSNLDVMWAIIHKIMVLSADGIFKKKWFKNFDRSFSKKSSKFHKLELLVSKIFKVSRKGDIDLMDSGIDSGHIAKEANIRSAIDKRMENFEVDKSHTIKSVLECPFRKVMLDHLVVDSELVLESDQVKSKMNVIMEEWTRKRRVVNNMSSEWCHQYQPLEYVFDEAFSGIMCLIGFDELFEMVSVLPDGKTAGLSGISNKLWKHCDKSVLEMLLVLLNSCLAGESVPGPWKKAWVSMIPKPYEWEGVLTNTYPIALIKTARKILSKVLSNRISAACSTFDVLHGDNFLVLKDMTTQSPIFAIGLVIEDALEKDRELWLVL